MDLFLGLQVIHLMLIFSYVVGHISYLLGSIRRTRHNLPFKTENQWRWMLARSLIKAALTWAVEEKTPAGSTSGCREEKAVEKLETWDKTNRAKKHLCWIIYICIHNRGAEPLQPTTGNSPKLSENSTIIYKLTQMHSMQWSTGSYLKWKLTCTRMRGLWEEGKGTLCIKWEMCLGGRRIRRMWGRK